MNFKSLSDKLERNTAEVCVVGLGYVGLPLSLALTASKLKVTGFDIDKEKAFSLRLGKDPTREIPDSQLRDALNSGINFTSEPGEISAADFVIICVPTPITKDKKPELKYIRSAGETVGKNLKKNSIVVLESTVYPGVTEDILKPLLERHSKMKCGKGFSLGYSPERMNPGDSEHDLAKITKVVSGCDRETAKILEKLYSRVAKAGIHVSKDIKTAEAAKIIENIQRDLNIALVNELSLIFNKMGLDTHEVIKTASTKWNFHAYHPGLVGGHCVCVDPYYLVHTVDKLGYKPKLILAGREINDYMPHHVADMVLQELRKAGKKPQSSKALLLGLTFKENVKDTRNSPAKGVIRELKKHGVDVLAHDPLLLEKEAEQEFGVEYAKSLKEIKGMDCIVIITAHSVFKGLSLTQLKNVMNTKPVIVDVRRLLNPEEAEKAGFAYRSL